MCFLGIGIVEYAEYASCSSVVLGGNWPQEDPQAVLEANLQPDGQTHGPPGKVGQTARECQRIAKMIHRDRKSTRLNSSHVEISYAVFCLKKKKKKKKR